MTIYYKATRPDGTDFYSGTILYEVGRTVRPHRTTGTPKVCGPGFLHASDVPAETLIGGSWPCRLFEVTGKPHAGFDGAHKGGFKQLRVVREIDPYLALGPNGRYVAAVVGRARSLSRDEAESLSTAWYAAGYAAWYAARNAAWDAARYAARYAAGYAAGDAAGGAAGDAALALCVRDLITPEQFEALYAPWRSVYDPTRPTRRRKP